MSWLSRASSSVRLIRLARGTFVATRRTLSQGGLFQADAFCLELRRSYSLFSSPVPGDRADGEESSGCTKFNFVSEAGDDSIESHSCLEQHQRQPDAPLVVCMTRPAQERNRVWPGIL